MSREVTKTITAIKLQKRNSQRINIYLDGEFAFGLSRIVGAWLHTGKVLNSDQIDQLLQQDTQEVAFQRSISYLKYRPRSEAEVRQHLHKHNISSEIIDSVIGKLREKGLIDDWKFAEAWIQNRQDFRPRGVRLLQAELRQKKISADIIEELLANVDEPKLAYNCAKKQSRKYRGLDRPGFNQKMKTYLYRRGFPYELARQTTDQIWREGKKDRQDEDTE